MNKYLHGKHWLTRRKLLVLSIIPLLIPILLQTNSSHKLIHPQISVVPFGPFQTLITSYGIGMWVFLAYNIALVVVGSIYIVTVLYQTGRTTSLRSIVILAGICVPILFILFQFSRSNPFGYFSPIPLVIIVSAIISAYILENTRRQQLVRVSRSKLFETINDVVFILDNQNSRIIDMNTSAEHFVGSSITELIGQSLTHAWPACPPKPIENQPGYGPKNRISVNRNGTQRIYDYKYIELLNWQNTPVNYLLVLRDITIHAELDNKISAALQEKETMLREIHHRAKNNLQVISSIFNLQSALIKDPIIKNGFQKSQDRIQAIALVHEQLYKTPGLQNINFAEYIHTMLHRLRNNIKDYPSKVTIENELDEIQLSIDMATPCGLIVYELVSNALKHAFPMGKAGIVTIGLHHQKDNQCMLTVRDNGVGVPELGDFQEGGHLGLKLVRTLVTQIGGSLTIDHQAGTSFQITFPIDGVSG